MFEILPHLFLGDANDAMHAMQSGDVKLVINCTKHLPFYSTGADVQHIRIAVEDDGNETDELIKHWTAATFDAIASHVLKGHDVLVHCQMGRQRSAATVAAFIMHALGWPLDKTIDHVKRKKRDAFFPEVNFMGALEAYEIRASS